MDVSRYITNLVAKLNLYIIPQYVWLVVTYYLMINVVLNYFFHTFGDQEKIIKSIPQEAIQFNLLVLAEIDKWLPLVWFLGVSIFFSGIIISFIEHIPYLQKERVARDGKYGLTLGVWLLLVAFTIEAFHILGGYFPFFLFGIAFIKLLIEELIKKKKYASYFN